MQNSETELVIRISTSESCPAKSADENNLIAGLKQCLRPGAVIALTYRNYVAITSVLWLSEPQEDNSFRAGVRLLGVSAAPQRELPGPPDAPGPLNHSPSLTLSSL